MMPRAVGYAASTCSSPTNGDSFSLRAGQTTWCTSHRSSVSSATPMLQWRSGLVEGGEPLRLKVAGLAEHTLPDALRSPSARRAWREEHGNVQDSCGAGCVIDSEILSDRSPFTVRASRSTFRRNPPPTSISQAGRWRQRLPSVASSSAPRTYGTTDMDNVAPRASAGGCPPAEEHGLRTVGCDRPAQRVAEDEALGPPVAWKRDRSTWV